MVVGRGETHQHLLTRLGLEDKDEANWRGDYNAIANTVQSYPPDQVASGKRPGDRTRVPPHVVARLARAFPGAKIKQHYEFRQRARLAYDPAQNRHPATGQWSTSRASRLDFTAMRRQYQALDDAFAAQATAQVRRLAVALTRRQRADHHGGLQVTAADLAGLKRVARDRLAAAQLAGATHARADLRRAGHAASHSEPQYTAPQLLDILAFNWAQAFGEQVSVIVRHTWAAGVAANLGEAAIVQSIQDALVAYVGEDPTADVQGLADSPARIATAVRTSDTTAFVNARRQVFEDPRLQGFVEAYENTSVLDDRTTDFCRAMDGLTFAVDSPVWDRPDFYPPSHYNCRRDIIPVVAGDDWAEDTPPAIDPPGF